jgi:hypothetical protein
VSALSWARWWRRQAATGLVAQLRRKLRRFLKTVLELGSNDAYMVFDERGLSIAVKSTSMQGRIIQ